MDPVICDTGTGSIKAGIIGDVLPRVEIPSITGIPQLRFDANTDIKCGALKFPDSSEYNLSNGRQLIGEEAVQNRSLLAINYPMVNGCVSNWDDMERLWELTWKKLKINPAERKLLMTEPMLNPKKHREKMCEIMFEKFNFESLHVAYQPNMALLTHGLTTGLVVDSGEGITNIVPVTHGYCHDTSVQRYPVAGRRVTEHLLALLQKKGTDVLTAASDLDVIRMAKQKLCYVAYDVAKEQKLHDETVSIERKYVLPDSMVVNFGSERFMAPEIMFTPKHFDDTDKPGLTESIFNVIMNSSIDNRKELFNNIILSGGNTMFPGIALRVQRDIQELYNERVLKNSPDTLTRKQVKVAVANLPHRQYSVFEGCTYQHQGIISNGMQSTAYVSRFDYDEYGGKCIHKVIDNTAC